MASSATKTKIYKRPPVIEAVIEVRFANALKPQQLEKLVSRLKSKFIIQLIQGVEVTPSLNEKSEIQLRTENIPVDYKLIEIADTSNIIQIKRDAISFSRLPPYQGGAKVVAEFKKYYDKYTDKKFKQLTRIGVRYINRIDIPSSDEKIKVEDYFRIYPYVPSSFPTMNNFLVHTVAPIENNSMLTVNISPAIESPLLKHMSIIFDLDIAQTSDLPTNNELLYARLDNIREQKNFFFESLLMAKCKRLFN